MSEKEKVRTGWKSRVVRRRLLLALLALASATLFGELFLRSVLLTSMGKQVRTLAKLRHPSSWGDHQSDDMYWIAAALSAPAEERLDGGGHHPVVGWLLESFDPDTLRHKDETRLEGRRPILLYGDSYAQCNTEVADCWQTLLQQSALSSSAAMLNYGVGGYGADQVFLLMKSTLGHYAALKPLVVVALMVDDDWDRASLSIRGRPKPAVTVRRGKLDLSSARVPPPAQFFGWTGKLSRTSLLFDFLSYQLAKRVPALGARRFLARDQHKQALSKALMDEMVAVARGHGVELVFVVFNHYPSLIDPSMSGWREPLMVEHARDLGVPCLVLREQILAEAQRRHTDPADLYGGTPQLEGHWNALGNRVAFFALGRELARFLGRPELVQAGYSEFMGELVRPDEYQLPTLGPGAVVRLVRESFDATALPEDLPQLVLRLGEKGPLEVRWDAHRSARTLQFDLCFGPAPGGLAGRAHLECFGDGRSLWQWEDARGAATQPVEIALDGVAEVRLVLSDGGDGPAGDCLVLKRTRFE